MDRAGSIATRLGLGEESCSHGGRWDEGAGTEGGGGGTQLHPGSLQALVTCSRLAQLTPVWMCASIARGGEVNL